MAMPMGMGNLCDCTGLTVWPNVLGGGKASTYCPLTNTCVGHNCCEEDTVGLGNVMCSADPTCQKSDSTF
jgi:hypothetical protein